MIAVLKPFALLLALCLLFALSSCADPEAIRKEGYDAGYAEGHEKGTSVAEGTYDKAYSAGFIVSDDKLAASRSSGQDEGYTAGYADAIEAAPPAAEYNNDADSIIEERSIDDTLKVISNFNRSPSNIKPYYIENYDGTVTYHVYYWLDEADDFDEYMANPNNWKDTRDTVCGLFASYDKMLYGDIRYYFVRSETNRTPYLIYDNGTITYDFMPSN